MKKLDEAQVAEQMRNLPDWAINGDLLQRTFAFDDFEGAMAFVNRIADLAEDLQHHPDILIRYNKVTLTLTTHDAGGLTRKDFAFARATESHVGAA